MAGRQASLQPAANGKWRRGCGVKSLGWITVEKKVAGMPLDLVSEPLDLLQERCMYFLGLGLVLLALKFLEYGPVANLSWVWVLAPFGLAVAWWAWADASGYTKRRAVERENERKNERIKRNRENIGTLGKSRKR